MRYEDWDVLLFPKDSKVPFKEFKTQCHVVNDTEFAYTHGSYGLPTMTCFIPRLSTGSPFNISLHCWSGPEISPFTRSNFNKYEDLVHFEARVFIDGGLVASASINRNGPWPQLIYHSFDFTKNGELEHLRFPSFRSELLRQSYWSPADELGRIKIIISEGFPRDSLTVPVERVKNLVAFSFQHAPIDILESSGIAWPNPAMWRRGPFNPTMPVPTDHPSDASDSHMHSPRRKSAYSANPSTNDDKISFLGSLSNSQPFLETTTYLDSFNSQPHSQSLSDPNWTAGLIPSGLATTLTNSLLNQPIPTHHNTSMTSSPPSSRSFSGIFSSCSNSAISPFGHNLANINPVATFTNPESNSEKIAKRSRHATPSSSRAVEEEEENSQQYTPEIRIGFGEDLAN